MQNITKCSSLFLGWRNMQVGKTIIQGLPRCSCRHINLTNNRGYRCCSHTLLSFRTVRRRDLPITFSVIKTLQRKLCRAYSSSTTSGPPDNQGNDSDLNPSDSSKDSKQSAPDFSEVESRQEGLLDEEIEDFYREEEVDEEVTEWVPPVSLTRGTTGVFDLEELLTVLREENARDICVIKMPPEVNLTNHMVIASAISLRHLRAITSSVNYIYKQKKHDSDPFLLISGEDDKNSEWLAVDLGNAFLHVMMPETRLKYDIEGLWLFGDQKTDQEEEVDFIGDFDWVKELQLKRDNANSTQESEESGSKKNTKSNKTASREEDNDWIN